MGYSRTDNAREGIDVLEKHYPECCRDKETEIMKKRLRDKEHRRE